MAKHYRLRGGRYEYYRRVPREYRHIDSRTFVQRSLRTDSETVAREKSAAIDRELDEQWRLLADAQTDAATRRHDAIVKIARAQGFAYRAAPELESDASIEEILGRVERLMAVTPRGQEPADDIAAALLGGSEPPAMRLSEAFEFYFAHAGDKIANKSEAQARRWRGPRDAAARQMIEIVGDLPLDTLTRQHMLQWRDGLWQRVASGQIKAESANKAISYVASMLRDTRDKAHVSIPDLSNLKFAENTGSEREPFSTKWMQTRLLAPGAFDGLNSEARRIFFALIETGCRPSELCNLMTENVHLEAEVPHIKIAPTAERALKTKPSRRDIPLVGVSLAAIRAQVKEVEHGPGSAERPLFPRYVDKNDTLSATVNKYMRDKGLAETPKITVYGTRHAFEDRMIAAGSDDRMRAEMMGHAYKREKYGRGPSLDMKRELLMRMVLDVPDGISI